ncbi:uncharacterized protein RCC_06214 [Ramularia collo-cygni]|uniref:Uncharacterized protein n=1 Tax=Ramularia collo-cygni TaxID=112498 RepID=A0A2D3V0W5_9PEZI|nr:uncharacterized protein RCC_06214 [Ramularia collo-cygni]CZT20355.1 uncharacterized protein RCC_06214 [Ramularia collo-cygni]
MMRLVFENPSVFNEHNKDVAKILEEHGHSIERIMTLKTFPPIYVLPENMPQEGLDSLKAIEGVRLMET